MKRRLNSMTPCKIMVIAGSIVLYVIILTVLLVLVFQDEEQETVFGSTEGRFLSDITMEYEGDTYYYRENQITNYLIICPDEEDGETDSQNEQTEHDDLVVLRIDRSNTTVTPVTLDLNIAEHPELSADASEYDDIARYIGELLYGVKIDNYFVLSEEADAELDRFLEPSFEAPKLTVVINSMSGVIQTDASWNTLLNDVSKMVDYDRCESQTLEFSDDEQILRETILQLWFQKGS